MLPTGASIAFPSRPGACRRGPMGISGTARGNIFPASLVHSLDVYNHNPASRHRKSTYHRFARAAAPVVTPTEPRIDASLRGRVAASYLVCRTAAFAPAVVVRQRAKMKNGAYLEVQLRLVPSSIKPVYGSLQNPVLARVTSRNVAII